MYLESAFSNFCIKEVVGLERISHCSYEGVDIEKNKDFFFFILASFRVTLSATLKVLHSSWQAIELVILSL